MRHVIFWGIALTTTLMTSWFVGSYMPERWLSTTSPSVPTALSAEQDWDFIQLLERRFVACTPVRVFVDEQTGEVRMTLQDFSPLKTAHQAELVLWEEDLANTPYHLGRAAIVNQSGKTIAVYRPPFTFF